jgi:alpha-galactosidase
MLSIAFTQAAEVVAIRTPSASAAPRINGPGIFGVRPQSPFLYTIPATGERPMRFSVENLPKGLLVDPVTGQITGLLKTKGEYPVVLQAKNSIGTDEKSFRIVVGEKIALTPAMGWNSWNCWADSVDQEKVLRSARALVSSGLINHGWTYINIDDTWQGQRTGKDHALQGNEKFSDLKGLCDEIHQIGLKAGIYSAPWVSSYGKYPGGSSDRADGAWSKPLTDEADHRYGKYSFAQADANQWAAWGFDYLKYDWAPNDVPHTAEMSQALRASGRDIVFGLSNTAPFDHAADWARLANSWRTTCDIVDQWAKSDNAKGDDYWQYAVSEIGFAQDRWAAHAGPGHWNDPDMLVVGFVGWGPQLHASHLTPDEQYAHISMWCLLSAPLLIGCDLERLDPFTISLLSNDEVLALDQDALGKQATRVATVGPVDVYLKELEDGSKALGFFNRDASEQAIAFDKLQYLGFKGAQHVRDLWRQKNISDIVNIATDKLHITIPAHGVELYKLTPVGNR